MTNTLYLISCATPPALHLPVAIRAAKAAGWDVCVILTPTAYRWLTEDVPGAVDGLEKLTGHPVRHQYKLPSQPDVLPEADAMMVAPMSTNTLNKWAAGISDTLALGLITEGIGLGKPIVALPHWNSGQDAHPVVHSNVATLREAGVTVLLGEGGFVPHRPRHGDVHAYPWQAALDALPELP